MTYLPRAGSLESDSTSTSPDRPVSPVDPDGLGGWSRATCHADSGAPGQAAALGQAISNRLFSAGLDLNFVMMTLNDGPGVGRLEHAITEIDDAIKDLRHLMLAITQQLA